MLQGNTSRPHIITMFSLTVLSCTIHIREDQGRLKTAWRYPQRGSSQCGSPSSVYRSGSCIRGSGGFGYDFATWSQSCWARRMPRYRSSGTFSDICDYFLRTLVHAIHQQYLVVALRHVMLIDADGIRPNRPYLILETKIAKGVVKRCGDGDA